MNNLDNLEVKHTLGIRIQGKPLGLVNKDTMLPCQ